MLYPAEVVKGVSRIVMSCALAGNELPALAYNHQPQLSCLASWETTYEVSQMLMMLDIAIEFTSPAAFVVLHTVVWQVDLSGLMLHPQHGTSATSTLEQ